jgi:alkanesulfonate monooxygenase SsuD/methylene tetrahydromethanopterin reductase-like flavin-dependent oxidoreductase (luciferase family)
VSEFHCGIIVPNFGEYSDPLLLAEMAREAEEAGWEGFFVWDQISMETVEPVCDVWIALALIARETKRIKLGPMVTPIPRRRPTTLARQSVTLDHVSGGRLILGVGLGAFQYAEFEALGDEPDLKLRAEMLDEGLEVLTGLWSGEKFAHEGKHYQIKDAQFLPKPVQQPRIPVWVAGVWPNKRPFRRAARWDGVMPGWDLFGDPKQSQQDVRDMVAYIKEHRTSNEPFEVAHGGKTSGTDQEADSKELSVYKEAGVTWWLEDLNPWRGPIEDMRERIRNGYVHI